MSSPHTMQAPNIQPQPKGRRTRSLRSCLACRKAKQRCELPDSPACIPSKEPQPANLVCRRCKVMRFDCIVSDPLPESVTSGKAASRKRKRAQQDSPAQGQQQQAPHHSSGSQSHSSKASSSVSLYNGYGPSPPTSHAPLDATSSSSSRPGCSRTPDERSPEHEHGSGALSYRSIGHSSSILHPLTSFERSCSDRSSTKHGEVRERECRSAGLDFTGNVPLDNVSGAPPYKRRPLPNAVPTATPAGSDSALSTTTSSTDHQTSRPLQRLIHELQVFDPSPSFGIRQPDADVRASDEVLQRRAGSDQASREPEWMQRLKVVMLPFVLLDKLCSVQCDKLTLVDGDLATPPDENLDTSVGSSDIEPFLALLDRMSIGGQQVAELDERLKDLVATLPWLPSISTLLSAARRFDGKVLNLLVACLYFAAGKAGWLRFKAALLPWLRRGCLGCLLQAPQGPEDVAFLLYVALYEPLLLNSASGVRSLDGKGFLASASAAARNLGLDKAPARLAAALHELPPGADLASLATVQQEAVLWVSLSLHAVTRSMAETIDREPMARCTEEDCETIVHLADRLGQNRSPQATWRAIGLYFLAEHAKLAEHGRQLDRISCKALSRKFKTSDEFHLEAEKVAEDYDTYRIRVAERTAIFWRRCRALGFEDESVVDWVNIEFIFLMLLCEYDGRIKR
ncbi:hypothetical protein IE81DRAFT_122063 [Ceraceosorus guamensis]|uniref:Zn(2)-C6 fungal-type domain-containing protein n=1 Tax=Ceraceosorus guamensis TaxID=1522189 RepID=A0A316W1G1_9BASI|nr:hypothetical protein IE81DRAFT_122063 [Ceraceosorus guamensis]PWN42593.1 hypothetical protein IE81DRAFT_122063 [Ceraceosorus guamensis]